MTDKQRELIRELRAQGVGYIRIANAIGLSPNTVKSFCQNHELGGLGKRTKIDGLRFCKFCGKEVKQTPGRKEKKFCCDEHRRLWWNSNQDKVKKKAYYEYVCPICNKEFTAYGNANRKYCSRLCYLTDRYRHNTDNMSAGNLALIYPGI